MVFEHSSAPASIKPHKSKYRDDETPLPLSSDPRVIRGSATALARKVAASKSSTKKMMSQSVDMSEYGRQLPRPTYEFEVKGHVGPDVDLSDYLIAKDDGILPKMKEVISQTDAFKDRPPSPAYKPRKTGIDGATQVEDVRELFDFDMESTPIVDVIVSKTLEQAILEVRHEEELSALEVAASEFKDVMAKEKDWQRAREAESLDELMSHSAEMGKAQHRGTEQKRVTTAVGGMQCMQQLLPGIFENAVEDLYVSKEWPRPERQEVELNAWPHVINKLRLTYKANGECKKIIEEIAEEAQKKYEELTHVTKPPRNDRCVLLNVLVKAASGEGDDAAVPAKKIDPIKIYGSVSCVNIVKQIRDQCAEKEMPILEVNVSLLAEFFLGVIGRRIAIDGAIINFSEWLPDELTLSV